MASHIAPADGPTNTELVPDLAPIRATLRGLRELLVVGAEERLVWLAVAVLAVVGAWLLTRGRRGRLPQPLSILAGSLRALAILVAMALLLSLSPAWLAPALFIAFSAAAAAVGWSFRDVLPDINAWLWLLIERRVVRGTPIAGESAEGVVERLGIRSSWIRSSDGRRQVVPNRRLLTENLVIESGRWPRVEVRIRRRCDAATLRRAARQAVSSSPLVPIEPEMRLSGLPEAEDQWLVSCRIVSLTQRARFEGELQERLDAFLSELASETAPGG
ncbi:MAG: mechanosensitive ion channel family protein [Myxococcota bacterium]